MRQVVAILGWAFAFWLTPAIAFAYSGASSGPVTLGTIHLFSSTEILLRVYIPMGCGTLGMGLGLLGLLPGTGPDDSGKSEE